MRKFPAAVLLSSWSCPIIPEEGVGGAVLGCGRCLAITSSIETFDGIISVLDSFDPPSNDVIVVSCASL